MVFVLKADCVKWLNIDFQLTSAQVLFASLLLGTDTRQGAMLLNATVRKNNASNFPQGLHTSSTAKTAIHGVPALIAPACCQKYKTSSGSKECRKRLSMLVRKVW